MGVCCIGSSSCVDPAGQSSTSFSVNPNPANYTILDYKQYKFALVVQIKYHDCTNYEGNKILVFEDCTLDDLKKQKLIDPHFCDSNTIISPVARFEPTRLGFELAYNTARHIDFIRQM